MADDTVDLTNSARKFWVMKLPKDLSEAWRTVGYDEYLGDLTIVQHNPHLKQMKINFKLNADTFKGDLEENYNATLEQEAGLQAFSETEEGLHPRLIYCCGDLS